MDVGTPELSPLFTVGLCPGRRSLLMLLVPPFEVGLLIFVIQLAKVSMGIVMRVRSPTILIGDLAVVPDVIVPIGWVINSISRVYGTAG